MIIIWIISYLTICGLTMAQVPGFGECPRPQVKDDFDIESYMGNWYEIEGYPFVFTLAGRCITANYTLNEDGTVNVLNSMINRISGVESNAFGTAKVDSAGKLLVSFDAAPTFTGPSNYWILDTDYTSYSVVFSCRSIGHGFVHATTIWILAREREPPIDVLNKSYKVLEENNISKMFLIRRNQNNCEPATKD